MGISPSLSTTVASAPGGTTAALSMQRPSFLSDHTNMPGKHSPHRRTMHTSHTAMVRPVESYCCGTSTVRIERALLPTTTAASSARMDPALQESLRLTPAQSTGEADETSTGRLLVDKFTHPIHLMGHGSVCVALSVWAVAKTHLRGTNRMVPVCALVKGLCTTNQGSILHLPGILDRILNRDSTSAAPAWSTKLTAVHSKAKTRLCIAIRVEDTTCYHTQWAHGQ